MGKKEFAAAELDPEHEIYIIHIASLSSTPLIVFDIYPSRRPQISGSITEETLIKVSVKYLDFADIFSPDLTSELFKHTGINDYAIKLVDG